MEERCEVKADLTVPAESLSWREFERIRIEVLGVVVEVESRWFCSTCAEGVWPGWLGMTVVTAELVKDALPVWFWLLRRGDGVDVDGAALSLKLKK
jgi:hypothetical protein